MDSMQLLSVQELLEAEDDYRSRHLDPKDQVALSSLEDPARIQAWCKARREEYIARTRALSSVYNAAAPINRLPPELLTMIFTCLEATFRTASQYLLVCRTWTRLILRSHRFWVNVLGSHLYTDFILAREGRWTTFAFYIARTGTLRLSLHTSGSTEHFTALCLASHTRRVVRWSHSLRSFHEAVRFNKVLAAHVYALEELRVEYEDCDPYGDEYRWAWAHPQGMSRPSFLFSHPFDPSSFARLRYVSIPWDIFTPSSTLGALQHLLLDGHFVKDERHHHSFGKKELGSLLRALTQCPNLVLLEVQDDLTQAQVGASEMEALDAVELPHLAQLSIEVRCPRFAAVLLSRLVYPSTTRVYLDLSRLTECSWLIFTGFPTDWRAALMLSHASAFSAAKAIAFDARVRRHKGVITTFSSDLAPSMEMTVRCDPSSHCDEGGLWHFTDDFAKLASYTRSITSLTISNPWFRKPDWEVVLGALPQLVELRSRGRDDKDELLPLLLPCPDRADSPSSPGRDDTGRDTTRFGQQLRTLGFYWTYAPDYRVVEEGAAAEDEDEGEIRLQRSMDTLADTLAAMLSVRAPFRRLSVLVPAGGSIMPVELQSHLRQRFADLVEVVEAADHFDDWLIPCRSLTSDD